MREEGLAALGRRIGAVVAILAIVLAAGASDAEAQGYFGKNKVQYQSFDWHIYKSPHFDVYYYPEEEPFLQQMVSFAESAYLYLSRAFDHEPKFRIPLIYYRIHAEFEQTNVTLGGISEGILAFADPLEHRVVIPIDQPPDKIYKTIVHEMTHIFEFSILYQDSLGRAMRGSPPGWLMEGLASHMAKDEDNIDKMIIRDAVINGLVPPITKVEGVAYIVYRYGRAAFDFIESKWGPEGIRTFLSEYRKILLTANIEKAIKESLGLDASEFDRLFQRYLRKQYLPTLLEKDEPEDYGKEIGFKLPGVHTFSPILSPSGDLVAVLTNRYDYGLDVVIISAKDGEVIKNLTKGFTNDYESVLTAAFEGKSDLAWSPDGDAVAFFVRKENRWILLLVNALTARTVKRVELTAANAASPAFSPDGKRILFSGNVGGVVDILELDLEGGGVRNITNDEYYDSNPSWSSDGKTILYNRRVDAYEKIFLLDYEDPSRKTQVTFGTTSEITPAFSRDGKRIYYSSDAGKEGIFNIYSLDLETGEVDQYTDVSGGYFHPQDRPGEGGGTREVATVYSNQRFRLFEVDTTRPIRVITPAEREQETGELKPFEPPLRLTLDESQKRPYDKPTYHIETVPAVGIGVASDGTFYGNAYLAFSDLLGDRRFWVDLTSVAGFQNLDTGYVNLQSRLEHYYRFQDYRDFLVLQTSPYTYDRQQSSRVTGLSTGLIYPFSKSYRVEASLGVQSRDIFDETLIPIDDPGTPGPADFAALGFNELKSVNPVFSAGFVGDTLRYNPWGPWHGKRFHFEVAASPFSSGDEATFVAYSLDYRAYGRATRRSLFAFRFQSYVANGKGSGLIGIGGMNQIRGYAFREFIGDRAAIMNLEYRFPLVDDLRFPFGSIPWIRGLLFLDVGAVWTQDGYFFDREFGNLMVLVPAGPNAIAVTTLSPGVFRDFKLWDSSEHRLRDGRASYGIGFNFRFGIFDLNWTFSKRLPFEEIDRWTCQRDVFNLINDPDYIDPRTGGINLGLLAQTMNLCKFEMVSDNGWHSDFYIGYAF